MTGRRRWLWLLTLCAGALWQCRCPGLNQTECNLDTDCALGSVCLDGACTVRATPCTMNADCRAEELCAADGYCQPGDRGAGDGGGPDAGVECAVGATRCVSGTQLNVCELGRWALTDCQRNSLVCLQGACQPPPCPADGGSSRCLDLWTAETCQSPAVRQDCPQGSMCWNGRCARSTGEACTSDAECAGGYCHCKPGECPGSSMPQGYCSQRGCLADGGAPCPVSDVCMGLASAGGVRVNLCGRRADDTCPESQLGQGSDYKGPYRRFLPIPAVGSDERYSFGAAVCFDPLPGAVGAACQAPADCIGGAPRGYQGQCLTSAAQGGAAGGLCTHACDLTHACPPGSACGHRPADPVGAGVCVLMCSQQFEGLATCNRSGLTCRQPAAPQFLVLDGRVDPLGYCFGGG